MATMERRKTLTINWDGHDSNDDDDDNFFDTCDRGSSADPLDLASSSDEDEDFEDSRMSFSSPLSSIQSQRLRTMSRSGTTNAIRMTSIKTPSIRFPSIKAPSIKAPSIKAPSIKAPSIKTTSIRTTSIRPPLASGKPPTVVSAKPAAAPVPDFNYDIWMAAPGSITERRKRLLMGMGLDENKELLKMASAAIDRAITRKFTKKETAAPLPSVIETETIPIPQSSVSEERKTEQPRIEQPIIEQPRIIEQQRTEEIETEQTKTEHSSVQIVLVRSRSDGDIDFSMPKERKEYLLGKISKQRLTRTASEIFAPHARMCPYVDGGRAISKESGTGRHPNRHRVQLSTMNSNLGAFFLIRNLDTGTEFIVNEYNEDGMWNRLSDLQTGKQLTMEEFEKSVGHSSVVKEAMKRPKDKSGKLNGHLISKSLKMSKKRGAAILKNIKSGFHSESQKEREVSAPLPPQGTDQKQAKNDWVKVRLTGKPHKDLSALHMCQEFLAHEGSIWTIKFSLDGHFLASAGEDQIIHVWEVQECELMSLRSDELGNLTPIHPSLLGSDQGGQSEADKKKKGKVGGSRKDTKIPDYVHVPETVFSLSEKPFCSFEGHSEDVLDLSWSKSQQLLSSSMDKSVRLWDLDTKTCLKVFAHNDYVTCIQFNPTDDDYFISGSLDGKVRIWNITKRYVVDWIDVNEMITAISYTPDAQDALVGTHKGSFRVYSTKDGKLSQTNVIEVRHKKKSQLRKITGFQFVTGNPSQVLVTSADSRIRLVDGTEVVQKFQGFRNTDSQIVASFTPDGRYIICASEDSQVYFWRYEETKPAANAKVRTVLVNRGHEHFQCKDVSVAAPWPCTIKGDPSSASANSKRQPPKRPPAPLPPSASSSPVKEENQTSANNKKMLPPLPKKGANSTNAADSAVSPPLASSATEEDPEAISQAESGIGDSLDSGSASIKYGDSSPSISSATTPSLDSSTASPSAWGLVIVTAGFGGEIRCYQNFGMPRRIGRQTNLF